MKFIFLLVFTMYGFLYAYEPDTKATDIEITFSNSLEGFKTFSVLPQYWASYSPSFKSKVNEELIKELEKMGKVIKVKDLDVTPFAKSQALIGITVKTISENLEASLNLTTSATVKNPKKETTVLAWSARTFLEGKEEEKNQEAILAGVKEVLSFFREQYEKANKNEKPTFYFYS